ncbi:hypothetical protein CH63R_11058 [Colletotrichum higginsianum IMI 349063]|uniref:Uncharacterized protein n=1 Tax=Colletotrichum higginsianum (strain IMI 349063) TaxID=759273 RepID=A0A1B7XX75_COLHI|nr:hypothetical protein CH63R_11058 [Colletotrichum higginsianum IMI 349063]OBR04355.1 hypothetical protein CH63R_11058 [Colletotrichum higginsianum IMI 349063]
MGWEWLEPTTEVDSASYAFNQPLWPLHMPATLHDAAHSLQLAGQITRSCQPAAETYLGLSSVFSGAFDSASSRALSNGLAFVFCTLAVIREIAVPVV